MAYVLAPAVGGITVSFSLLAVFYALLAILLVSFRKRLIIDPMVKFIAGLFMKTPEKNNPPTQP